MKMLKRVLCVFVVMMFALLFEASVFAQQLRLGDEPGFTGHDALQSLYRRHGQGPSGAGD